MTELPLRQASAADAEELLRLWHAMWADFGFTTSSDAWEDEFRLFFLANIGTDTYRVLVADHPVGSGLVACGIGVITQVTPAHWLTTGKLGYLQWFYTAPDFRRQGVAGRIVRQLQDWLLENGVHRAHLHASPDAEQTYKGLGFENSDFVNLWWSAPGT